MSSRCRLLRAVLEVAAWPLQQAWRLERMQERPQKRRPSNAGLFLCGTKHALMVRTGVSARTGKTTPPSDEPTRRGRFSARGLRGARLRLWENARQSELDRRRQDASRGPTDAQEACTEPACRGGHRGHD